MDAKLRRAEEHFHILESQAAFLMNSNFHVEFVKNTECTRHSIIYRCRKEPDFESWSLMFGDGIHNLRTALDHFVYAIAIHESGKNPPPQGRRLAFPIVSKPETFSKFREQKLDGVLSTDVIEAIETLQPYNRRHPHSLPLLYLLREFDDADKHRLLQLTVTQAVEWIYDNIRGLSPESGQWRTMHYDVWNLRDNTEIATIVTDGPAPNLTFDKFTLGVAVVVGHEPGPSGKNYTVVGDMIDDLALEVAHAMDTMHSAVK